MYPDAPSNSKSRDWFDPGLGACIYGYVLDPEVARLPDPTSNGSLVVVVAATHLASWFTDVHIDSQNHM